MPQSTQACILIVDDDLTVGLLAKETLTQGGFTVQVAQTATQMRKLLQDFPADMILLDMRLPDASGTDLCSELRTSESHAHTPILMITGSDDNESILQAYAAGATDFMPKPLNWHLLLQRVRYMWRSHQVLLGSQQSEQLLTQAQRMAMMGNWERQINADRVTVSKQFSVLFGNGKSDGQSAFQAFLQTIPEEERAVLAKTMKQVVTTEKPATLTHRVCNSKGVLRSVRHDLDIRHNSQGKIVTLCGTIQDITRDTLRAQLVSDRNQILESMLQNATLDTLHLALSNLLTNQIPGSELIHFSKPKNSSWENVYCSPGLQDSPAFIESLLEALERSHDSLTRIQHPKAPHEWLQVHFLPILTSRDKKVSTLICAFIPEKHSDQENTELAYVFQTLSDITAVVLDNHRLTRDLQHQAFHDSLTGLPNRFYLFDNLRRVTEEGRESNHKRAIIFIALDRFKTTNDLLGHAFGDKVLQEVAKRLRAASSPDDILARTGGDEFMLISEPLNNYSDAEHKCMHFINAIAPSFEEGNFSFNLSASVGVSLFPVDSDDPSTLYQYADMAMQYAKKNGGGELRYYNKSIMGQFLDHLELENDMARALEQGEFYLVFQPQMNMASKTITGYEALLRWRRPDGRLIPPSIFIPIAEETGFIVILGSWVLERACRAIKKMHQKEPEIYVAVNVSTVQFVQDNFLESVQQILEKTDFPAHKLGLEMTESTVMHDISTVAARLDALRAMGITISIDDFGTGYSSMSYLKSLPIDNLKIDRSFIMEIGSGNIGSKKSEALVDALITLADNLGLTVTAEGVENEKQLEFLSQKNCYRAQGYHTGRPAPLPDPDKLSLIPFPYQSPLTTFLNTHK